jgi:hypothetical protein
MSRQAGQDQAFITKSAESTPLFAGDSHFAKIDLRETLLAFARSDVPFSFDGVEDLAGRRCTAISFWYASGPDLAQRGNLSEKFWIDFERGGLVLRHERRDGSNLMELTMVTKVHKYDAPSGKSLWLPTAGQAEGYMTINPNEGGSPRVYTPEPICVVDYALINGTMRLEQGLEDEHFSVNAAPGDIISDEFKKARYEYGQYLVRSKEEKSTPVTDNEIQANLERMLSDADLLSKELKATSPARSGPDWSTYAPWTASALALTGLAVVNIRRRAA